MTQRDMPDDAALDALVRRWRKHSNCNRFAAATVEALTALRAQNAALQAQVTALSLDAMARDTADEIVGRDEIAEAARVLLESMGNPPAERPKELTRWYEAFGFGERAMPKEGSWGAFRAILRALAGKDET